MYKVWWHVTTLVAGGPGCWPRGRRRPARGAPCCPGWGERSTASRRRRPPPPPPGAVRARGTDSATLRGGNPFVIFFGTCVPTHLKPADIDEGGRRPRANVDDHHRRVPCVQRDRRPWDSATKGRKSIREGILYCFFVARLNLPTSMSRDALVNPPVLRARGAGEGRAGRGRGARGFPRAEALAGRRAVGPRGGWNEGRVRGSWKNVKASWSDLAAST